MSIVNSNTMSLDEHVKKINLARDKVQAGIFEMALSITEAVTQLGGKQIELAQRLGMSKGTISKWISIGSNSVIMSMQKKAPSSFDSLYQLSSLDNQYSKYYGEEEGKKKFIQLFENKEVTDLSDRNDIAQIIKNHKKITKPDGSLQIKELEKYKSSDDNVKIKSEIRLKVLIKSNLTFNTIIVIPSVDQLLRWKKLEGSDLVNEDYPIGKLENLDNDTSQQCLIKIRQKNIQIGLECLLSWGFTYSDILLPNQPQKGLVSAPSEFVILKGQKGFFDNKTSIIKSASTLDLITYSENWGIGPFLLVGDVTTSKNWIYCVN